MSIPPTPPVPTGASPSPVAAPAPTIPLRPLGGSLGGGLKIAGSRGLSTKPLTLQQPGVPSAPAMAPTAPVPPPLPSALRPPAIPSAATPPTPPAGTAPAPIAPTVPIGSGLRPPMAPPAPAQQAAYNTPSVALNPSTVHGAPAPMPMQSAVPTAVMPSATVSLTPTIGLPTGQQGGTRPNSVNTMDMAEEPKENKLLLSLSVAAAVLAVVFCLLQYNIDQLPHRASIGVGGDPLAVPTTEGEEESYE